MEQIFEKVIEIEQRAKEVYEDAVKQTKQMKEELQREIHERENEIKEMAAAKIRQLEASGKKDVDDRLERINRQVQEKLLQLDAIALENAKKWEDVIFSRIIGE